MENQKCPVCEAEYLEDKDKCGNCGWILKDFEKINFTELDESPFQNLIEFQKQINAIGKDIWHKWKVYHLNTINKINQELTSQIEQLQSQIKQLVYEKGQLQSQIETKNQDKDSYLSPEKQLKQFDNQGLYISEGISIGEIISGDDNSF